jgi:hypothetical protein
MNYRELNKLRNRILQDLLAEYPTFTVTPDLLLLVEERLGTALFAECYKDDVDFKKEIDK